MSRCDHCKYRNLWECEDEFGRVSNKEMCEDFYLDYMTLTEKQKKEIQKRLMAEKE